MGRMAFVLGLLAVLVCTVGCNERVAPENASHLVELFSGGEVVRDWYSDGRPSRKVWETDSWYFTDATTDRVVRVTGTVVITQLN